MAKRSPQSQGYGRSVYLSAILILIAVGVVIFFAFFHKSKTPQEITTVSNTSTENNGTSSKLSQGPNQSLGNNQPAGSNNTGSSPQPPTGTFVSNHKPDLLGTPAPNSEQSTCIVPPGTSCAINFTQGSVTKSLEAQTAGANGVVAWSWTLQQVGLSQGSWNITAVSSLNGQTATTPDTIPLGVGP